MPVEPVKNPGLWRGEGLQKADNYIMEMSAGMVGEIKDAFQKAKTPRCCHSREAKLIEPVPDTQETMLPHQ